MKILFISFITITAVLLQSCKKETPEPTVTPEPESKTELLNGHWKITDFTNNLGENFLHIVFSTTYLYCDGGGQVPFDNSYGDLESHFYFNNNGNLRIESKYTTVIPDTINSPISCTPFYITEVDSNSLEANWLLNNNEDSLFIVDDWYKILILNNQTLKIQQNTNFQDNSIHQMTFIKL